MERVFADSLGEWSGFYALMGGAAATLLGLQFVAVSLRLNIFRRREVADVRDFAAFTFGTFLVAIAVAGLALAPHEARRPFAWALLALGLGGLVAIIWISRIWLELNRPRPGEPAEQAKDRRVGSAYLLLMTGAYLGLLAAAIFVWIGHPVALGVLAISEVWLLAMGTIAAWILLSHAGSDTQDGA